MQPLDALRTRCFLDTNNFNLKTLYNGFTFNASTSILKLSITYPTQEFLKTKLPIHQEVLSGILTGILLSFVGTPINAVKVGLMSNVNTNTLQVSQTIHKLHGMKGFYRGGVGTLLRDVVWNGIYFPAFQKLNTTIDNRFLASILASAFALCFSYPFDGIRMYRQNYKANYDFWYGFRYSFNLSKANAASFGICMLRVPLLIATSHYIYLLSNDVIGRYCEH